MRHNHILTQETIRRPDILHHFVAVDDLVMILMCYFMGIVMYHLKSRSVRGDFQSRISVFDRHLININDRYY